MGLDRRAVGRGILVLSLPVLYVLHQDAWNWSAARPLVFGLFPIGLFYHVCYSLAAAAVMALVVKYGWPDHLEQSASATGTGLKDAELPR
jgi:hypothetical protein